MPRVENLGDSVQDWCDNRHRDGGTTYDVCTACYRMLQADPHRFDWQLAPLEPGEPRGLDGWGGDVDHLPYAYSVAHCAVCGVPLTSVDDRRSLCCCSGETPEAGLRVSPPRHPRAARPSTLTPGWPLAGWECHDAGRRSCTPESGRRRVVRFYVPADHDEQRE